MRPFFGYNFGDYLRHWIQLGRFLIMVTIIIVIIITVIIITIVIMITVIIIIVIVAIIFFAVKELEEAASSVYGQLVPEGR